MLRMTPQQVLQHKARLGKAEPPAPRLVEKFRSKLEMRYAQLLDIRKHDGRIFRYGYERIKLRLPGGVFYTPDFDFTDSDGLNIVECKGFMREAARNKLRAAIETYPDFRWWIVSQALREIRLESPDDVPSMRQGVR